MQLDRSKVKVLGEMRNILIRLSIDSRVHQTINILVAKIPKAYGLLLRRDWSSQLNDYFATNWSHRWFPYNEKQNQIWVERVIEIEDPNELVMFIKTILGRYYFDTFFGDFLAEESLVLDNVVSELLFYTPEPTPRDEGQVLTMLELDKEEYFFTLHFDGSKTKEGVGVGCV